MASLLIEVVVDEDAGEVTEREQRCGTGALRARRDRARSFSLRSGRCLFWELKVKKDLGQ
jgi:hypothetical protein